MLNKDYKITLHGKIAYIITIFKKASVKAHSWQQTSLYMKYME